MTKTVAAAATRFYICTAAMTQAVYIAHCARAINLASLYFSGAGRVCHRQEVARWIFEGL